MISLRRKNLNKKICFLFSVLLFCSINIPIYSQENDYSEISLDNHSSESFITSINPVLSLKSIEKQQKKTPTIIENKVNNQIKSSEEPAYNDQKLQNEPKPELSELDFNAKPENSIINLSINNQLYYDYEVFTNKNGSYSLPIKTTAKLLDFDVKQNHYSKDIDIIKSDGSIININFKSKTVIYNGTSIDLKDRMVFIKNGLLEENKDEIFIPAEILEKILDTKIESDYLNSSISLSTNKMIKAIITYNKNQSSEDRDYFAEIKPSDDELLKNVIKPPKKKSFSVDNIRFENDSQYYVSKEKYLDYSLKDSLLNNLTNITIDGTLFGGDYEIKTDSMFYNKDLFSFGGISFNYNKYWNNYNLELGKIQGLKTEYASIGSGIFGFNFGNTSIKSSDLSSITGEIASNSKIKVTLNDKESYILNTYGGYYTLKDLPYPKEKVYKLRIEEISFDGKTKTIRDEYFPMSPDLLPAGKKEFSVFGGVTGLNDKFFSENYISGDISRKIAGGVRFSYGLSDKLTLNNYFIADHIISTDTVYNNYYDYLRNNYTLDVLNGYTRNYAYYHGQTFLSTIDYSPTDKLKLSGLIGFSHSRKVKDDGMPNIIPFGYSGSLSLEYKSKNWQIYSRLFNYSPGFYLAGSNICSAISDRLGMELGGSTKLGRLLIKGDYSKYYSNLDGYLPGGRYLFNNYNISLELPFKDGSVLGFSQRARYGSNNVGKLTDKTTEFSLKKPITEKLDFELFHKINDYNNNYFNDVSNKSFNSKYKLTTAVLKYNLSNKLGKIELSHDTIRAETNYYKNNYSSVRLTYTPPVIKRIITSASVGYHYKGQNKGFDFSVDLGYMFKSGRKLRVSYSYNRQLGYFVDDIFLPSSSRHSINMDITDSFSIIAGGIRSIGNIIRNAGNIEIITFLDVNQNGIKDKNEPVIPDIAIKSADTYETVFTNKKGKYIAKSLNEGIYKVGIIFDQLPALLSISPASREHYFVKVDKKNCSKVFFGLISSIGNVSGNIKIHDKYGRNVLIEDLIVSIFNDKGEEVKYTSVSIDGQYDFAGLSPGKYIVKLDQNFIKAYDLEPTTYTQGFEINIPAEYKNYFDINNADLEFIQTSSNLEVSSNKVLIRDKQI